MQSQKTNHVISSGIKGTGFLKEILLNMFGRRNSYNWANKLQAFRPIFTIVRNNTSFIKDSIKIPEPSIDYIKCHTPAHLLAISGAIDTDALKALNAGDIEKAVEILGCDQCSEETLVEQVTLKIREKKKKIETILQNKQLELDAAKFCASLWINKYKPEICDLALNAMSVYNNINMVKFAYYTNNIL